MTQPRYMEIKNYLLEQIEHGLLVAGSKVASENKLSAQFSVSRMTARRALDELADAGVLSRSQGLGTFVADPRPMSSMLEIRNIADEIQSRGHTCIVEVVMLEELAATEEQAAWLNLTFPQTVFHSVLVYFENQQAIQFEDRYVNPLLVPDYLKQDFTAITPNEYLSKVAPLTEADHIVEAVLANSAAALKVAQHMDIAGDAACLKVTRRTFSKHGVVSMASLIHPGDRYRLGSHIQIAPQIS